MRDHYRYLIVGAGMAGDAAAHGIRERDPDGTIGVIGREPTAPVTRPALSKKLWTDAEFTEDQIWLPTADTGADLILGTSVTAIDRDAGTVTTDTGAVIGYDRLLLATSGHPTPLGLPASGRVLYYRTYRDYERLRELSGQGRHVVVVGGGYIGTELAAALVQNDTRVTLVFPDEVLTASTFPAALAERVERRFTEAGVELLPGARVSGGESTADGVRVELEDGRVIEADAAVIGTGITVETGLAEAAGLTLGDSGIRVDDQLRSSDERIWVAGDAAEYPDRILGRRRVEHVDHAQESGTVAGRNLAGAGEPYTHTPFYYSDLFELGYEAVGALDSSLATVEDWTTPFEEGVVYYLAEDGSGVAGVLLWNVWDATDAARRVIAEQTDVSADALRGLIG
jgi:3-phenylpropionate/trans-cinnamate dioxygenase ferredoxin reductase component